MGTLLVVVVCAVLAAVLAVLAALRLLCAARRRPTAPLPPVQPLKYEFLDSRPPSSVPDSPQNIPGPSFDLVSRPVPPRPVSSASLSSAGHMSRHTSRTTLRGVPHAPTSQLQIILPTPLSATVPRPRRDPEADKWVPVGRDSSSSRRAFTYFQHSSTPPPVPRIPRDII